MVYQLKHSPIQHVKNRLIPVNIYFHDLLLNKYYDLSKWEVRTIDDNPDDNQINTRKLLKIAQPIAFHFFTDWDKCNNIGSEVGLGTPVYIKWDKDLFPNALLTDPVTFWSSNLSKIEMSTLVHKYFKTLNIDKEKIDQIPTIKFRDQEIPQLISIPSNDDNKIESNYEQYFDLDTIMKTNFNSSFEIWKQQREQPPPSTDPNTGRTYGLVGMYAEYIRPGNSDVCFPLLRQLTAKSQVAKNLQCPVVVGGAIGPRTDAVYTNTYLNRFVTLFYIGDLYIVCL